MFSTPDLIFIFFSLLLIVFSSMVILSRHPAFSLLFLVGSFISASCLLLLLECELLALLFLTVYVGAIAVLFLFAVMMLDFKHYSLQKNLMIYLPIGVFFGGVLLYQLIFEINTFFITTPRNTFYIDGHINWYDLISSTTETEALGHVLYSYFVLHFLVSGLILLVVLLGVVRLTNVSEIKVRNKNKTQALFKQLSKSPILKN
jgi:NADH-quinone oxidoreductase subunit J